jgi:phosphatidate phosphatase APP1
VVTLRGRVVLADDTLDDAVVVLVGDDGEHDPEIYADFVRRHPGRVVAVAIRQVRIGGDHTPGTDDVDGVPLVHAPDGAGLAERLADVLAGLPGR